MKAEWNGKIIAESEEYHELEGNIYFPPANLKMKFFTNSTKTSQCPWKGTALYYDVTVGGKMNKEAAWYTRGTKKETSIISSSGP